MGEFSEFKTAVESGDAWGAHNALQQLKHGNVPFFQSEEQRKETMEILEGAGPIFLQELDRIPGQLQAAHDAQFEEQW